MTDAACTVLLIEDNPGDIYLVEDLVRSEAGTDFVIEHRPTLETGLARLSEGEVDLVLLDLSLPDCQGLETFTALQAQFPSVPVVVLSGLADQKVAVEAVASGAQDFLVKGQTPDERLIRTLRYAIERKQFQRSQEASQACFRRLFEATSAGVFQLDLDGRLVAANPALLELLEYPPWTGLDTITTLDWRLDDRKGTPLLLEAERRKELRNVECRLLSRGGTERVVLADVQRTAEGFQGSFTDITERKHWEEQLVYLADHDPLTHLYNRRRFFEELQRQIAHVRRYDGESAVLWIDLDRFKQINDAYGHRAGDLVLVSVANLLRSQVRASDVVARMGGDEFAVLLSQSGEQEAKIVARNLLDAIERLEIAWGADRIGVTASLGVALVDQDSTEVEDLINRADLAMYRSKRGGRDLVCLSRDSIPTPSAAQVPSDLAGSIREAIDNDAFVLYAQPIVALPGRRTIGYELLVRMLGPGDEPVPPGAFMDFAERSGLIQEIDLWVVKTGLAWLAEQRSHGTRRGPAISINLSARTIGSEKVLDYLRNVLAAGRVDPAQVILEVTESGAIQDLGRAQRFMTALGRLGCAFALDDFGIGFSSFFQLKHLPVDYLKIDGSFIRELGRSAIDQHLVQAMVGVAKGLGLKTIAECVEDGATLELLERYGIEYAQGYYLGRPAPLSEVSLVAPPLRSSVVDEVGPAVAGKAAQ